MPANHSVHGSASDQLPGNVERIAEIVGHVTSPTTSSLCCIHSTKKAWLPDILPDTFIKPVGESLCVCSQQKSSWFLISSTGNCIVRQLGLRALNTHHRLSELANNYLRENKDDPEGSKKHIFSYLHSLCSKGEIESLYTELVQEFNACVISYFAFHWEHSSFVVDQVLEGSSNPKKKFRVAVLSATRKQRFERVQKILRTKNVFSTLLEQLKALGRYKPVSDQINVVVPTNRDARSPVLLLVGGGAGAGKSSVVRDRLKCLFCSDAAESAVVVEADAFKETDLVYQALSSNGPGDMLETAEFVHNCSTDAASSLLVAALNEGRDIIFDGTMSWEPYIQQTIAMVRNVHHTRYRMGPGYRRGNDGIVYERYWEPIDKNDSSEEVCARECAKQGMEEKEQSRKPYRIELIGVICDAAFAVVRGMRRAILTKRAVQIRRQLTSHKLFARQFYRYCELVDNAKLYCTNRIGGPPELIWSKESESKLAVEPEDVKRFLRKLGRLNSNAQSILELYNEKSEVNNQEKEWKNIVLSSERHSRQQLLRARLKGLNC